MQTGRRSFGIRSMYGSSEDSAVSTSTMSFNMMNWPQVQRRRPSSLGISECSRQPSVQYSNAEKFIDTYRGNKNCAPQHGDERIRTPRTMVILRSAFQVHRAELVHTPATASGNHTAPPAGANIGAKNGWKRLLHDTFEPKAS